MIDFRLANVVLEDAPRSDDYPELYVRRSPAVTRKGTAVTVSGAGAVRLDFATYLNAFSNVKWRRYTVVDNVWLHLRARGSFTLEPCRIDKTGQDPKRTILDRIEFDEAEMSDIEYEFSADDATMLSFSLVCDGTVSIEEAWYYTKVDETLVHPVELAIATTTFKKEDYITRNLELMREGLLGCEEPVAEHLTVHVMDNGSTLDVEALSSERIRIHPQGNVGGSGGFTRGMIEAMEQEPRATHVLLMDDDVELLPEAVKRTYNLLSLVNDEYAEGIVSGAMMAIEKQDMFHEDTGFVQEWGAFAALKSETEVDSLAKVVKVECVEPHAHNRYAGWWYCCIPVTVIERQGLPLPLFIRADDVEYGLRSGGPFMTMNGICIWHMVFADKYRAFFERYQFNRNVLVAQATTGAAADVDFLDFVKANIQLDFKHFNYEGVELALDALNDFMKGPEWLMAQDPAELLAKHGAKNDKPLPIDQIDDEAVRKANFNPDVLYKTMRNSPLINSLRTIPTRAFDYGTQNGQKHIPQALVKGGLAIICYDGWAYNASSIRGADAVLTVSRDGSEGVLRKKDVARFRELDKRYKETLKRFDAQRTRLYAEYAAAREKMTSIPFWKGYLGME